MTNFFDKYKQTFKNRGANPVNNLGGDLKDIFGGVNYLINNGGDVAQSVYNDPVGSGKQVLKGLAESYGQPDVFKNGFHPDKFDPAMLGASFYANPTNLLDFAGMGLASKAGKALKATKTFDKVAEATKALGRAKQIERTITTAEDVATGKGLMGTTAGKDWIYNKGSKGLIHAEYDPEKQLMKASFASQGDNMSHYKYSSVTPDQWDMLKHAENRTSTFSKMAKGDDGFNSRMFKYKNAQKPVFGSFDNAEAVGKPITKTIQNSEKVVDEVPTGMSRFVDKAQRVANTMQNNKMSVVRTIDRHFKRAVLPTMSWMAQNRTGNLAMKLMREGPAGMIDGYKMAMDPALAQHVPAEVSGSTHFTKEIGGASSTPVGKVIDKFMGGEKKMEGFDRSSSYLLNAKNLSKQTGIPLEDILKNPDHIQHLTDSVNKTLGDYGAKLPLGDATIAIDPFFRWHKVIAGTTTNLAKDKPVLRESTRALGYTGKDMMDQQNEALKSFGYTLPEYLKTGHVNNWAGVMGGQAPEMQSYDRMNPFSTMKDIGNILQNPMSRESMGMVNPLVGIYNRVNSGTNFFGGNASAPNTVTDFNGKSYYIDPKTRQIQSLGQEHLRPEDKLSYLGSELARAYTPAGIAERYYKDLSGVKPYDTKMFVQNASKEKNAPQGAINGIFKFATTGKGMATPTLTDNAQERILKRYDNSLGSGTNPLTNIGGLDKKNDIMKQITAMDKIHKSHTRSVRGTSSIIDMKRMKPYKSSATAGIRRKANAHKSKSLRRWGRYTSFNR